MNDLKLLNIRKIIRLFARLPVGKYESFIVDMLSAFFSLFCHLIHFIKEV